MRIVYPDFVIFSLVLFSIVTSFPSRNGPRGPLERLHDLDGRLDRIKKLADAYGEHRIFAILHGIDDIEYLDDGIAV